MLRQGCSWVIVPVLGGGLVVGLAFPVQAAMVGHWSWDVTYADVSPNQLGGSANTEAALSTTIPYLLSVQGSGKSLQLNGNAWVEVPAHPALNSNVFTLAFWFNQNGLTQPSGYARLTGRGGDTFEVGVSPAGLVRYYPGPGWQDTPYNLPGTGWTHLAFVSTGTQMSLYVNGKVAATGPFSGNPMGLLLFGARARSDIRECSRGLMDDTAIWNEALSPLAIQALATGIFSPEQVDRLPMKQIITITSDPGEWKLSTVRHSGGTSGTWTPTSDPLPDASTFTLSAPAGTTGVVLTAAADIGLSQILRGDGGAGNPAGIQYYRTTFELAPFTDIAARIVLAADNGAAVFINGQLVARETSFLEENWQRPYSSLVIWPDGTIHNVTLFDQVASSFTGWRVGANELILAIRNLDTEGLNSGALAFRMDIFHNVPEPSTIGLLALGGGVVLVFLLCSKRRKSPSLLPQVKTLQV